MSRLGAFALGLGLAVLAAAGEAADIGAPGAGSCAAPAALIGITSELPHAAARIDQHQPLTIVALGSSSTQGVGASAPDFTYPTRLEAELKQRFPDIAIRVVNRGKGGEDAREELVRLQRDVIALHPELVIWQIGTNAVLRRDNPTADRTLIERGVALLKQSGSDVVLMDIQYAPRVIALPAYQQMERLIAEASEQGHVGLFRRFEIMRQWHATRRPQDRRMVGPDGLHMTDRGYRCLAQDLAEALAANWSSQQRLAAKQGPRRARIAGLAGAEYRPAGEPPAP